MSGSVTLTFGEWVQLPDALARHLREMLEADRVQILDSDGDSHSHIENKLASLIRNHLDWMANMKCE